MKTTKEINSEWKTITKSYSSLISILQEYENDKNKDTFNKVDMKNKIEKFRKDVFNHQIAFNKLVIDVNKFFVDEGIV